MSRRARNPLSVVVTAAVLGSLLLAVAYFYVNGVAHRVNPQPETAITVSPRVPVLSARRAPNTLSTITRIDRLDRALTTVEGRVPSSSCLAVNWMDRSMLDVRADTAFVPASSTKLITAAVALKVLGKDFTYTTNVHAKMDASGTTGDLYFVGGGDPSLIRAEYPSLEKYATTAGTSLEKLADAIVASGVRQISGSVVGVDTRYDNIRFVADWPTSFYMTEAGPLGALFVDDGMILGQQFKPDNPALAASQELTNLLVARGVIIAAAPRHEPLPDDVPVIASVTSAPLTSVLKDMLVNSDNNTAELVLKEIGFAAKKTGSTVAGLQTVQEVLAKWKIKDVVMNDGSGLASSNRISCSAFQKILAQEIDVFPSLLAIAGETGTIRDAFTDSSVKGSLVAKTGTLSGVKALTGYLTIQNSDPVLFSLIMNEAGIDNKSAYRPIWYALSDALNRAKSTPSLEQLIP